MITACLLVMMNYALSTPIQTFLKLHIFSPKIVWIKPFWRTVSKYVVSVRSLNGFVWLKGQFKKKKCSFKDIQIRVDEVLMNVGKKETKKMQNLLYCNFFCLCTPRYRVALWTVTWICLVTALELAATCRLLLRALLFERQ